MLIITCLLPLSCITPSSKVELETQTNFIIFTYSFIEQSASSVYQSCLQMNGSEFLPKVLIGDAVFIYGQRIVFNMSEDQQIIKLACDTPGCENDAVNVDAVFYQFKFVNTDIIIGGVVYRYEVVIYDHQNSFKSATATSSSNQLHISIETQPNMPFTAATDQQIGIQIEGIGFISMEIDGTIDDYDSLNGKTLEINCEQNLTCHQTLKAFLDNQFPQTYLQMIVPQKLKKNNYNRKNEFVPIDYNYNLNLKTFIDPIISRDQHDCYTSTKIYFTESNILILKNLTYQCSLDNADQSWQRNDLLLISGMSTDSLLSYTCNDFIGNCTELLHNLKNIQPFHVEYRTNYYFQLDSNTKPSLVYKYSQVFSTCIMSCDYVYINYELPTINLNVINDYQQWSAQATDMILYMVSSRQQLVLKRQQLYPNNDSTYIFIIDEGDRDKLLEMALDIKLAYAKLGQQYYLVREILNEFKSYQMIWDFVYIGLFLVAGIILLLIISLRQRSKERHVKKTVSVPIQQMSQYSCQTKDLTEG